MELKGLETIALGRDIVRLDEVDSTNNYAKEHAAELRHLTLVTAERQTGGKGRLGRSWSFQPGKSLAMSLLFKDIDSLTLGYLPILFALGVRDGLSELCGLSFDIKWSNDILLDSQKVCGILCESRTLSQSVIAVGGVGVNISQTRKELDNHDLLYASSLFLATGKLFSTGETAAAICNELEKNLRILRREGISPLLAEYRKHCVTLGRRVRIILNGGYFVATALDIAEDGSLICDIDGETIKVSSGEVSVRGLLGYAE